MGSFKTKKAEECECVKLRVCLVGEAESQIAEANLSEQIHVHLCYLSWINEEPFFEKIDSCYTKGLQKEVNFEATVGSFSCSPGSSLIEFLFIYLYNDTPHNSLATYSEKVFHTVVS